MPMRDLDYKEGRGDYYLAAGLRQERADLEDRILDVVREKRLNYAVLQRAEDEAGVPKGTKPSVEQLRAVVARLEAM